MKHRADNNTEKINTNNLIRNLIVIILHEYR